MYCLALLSHIQAIVGGEGAGIVAVDIKVKPRIHISPYRCVRGIKGKKIAAKASFRASGRAVKKSVYHSQARQRIGCRVEIIRSEQAPPTGSKTIIVPAPFAPPLLVVKYNLLVVGGETA